MTTVSTNASTRCLDVTWASGGVTSYPFIWLRDNCASNFHPQTEERVFELLHVSPDIAPIEATITNSALHITWSEGDHHSTFPLDWLAAHKPGAPAADAAAVPASFWRGDLQKNDVPSAAATQVLSSEDALLDWLLATKRRGIGLITGLQHDDHGMDVAKHIGFLRQTNFGTTFDVVSKPDPNNLAYTSVALPLHTDLTNQETPPGFQFLHCIANEAVGGASLFCDGFAIADDLRQQNPAAFDLLAETVIPMRFHDVDYDIRKHERVIRLNHLGTLAEIRFNAHLAGVFDLPADIMAAYYDAYRAYMTASRDPAYVTTFKLNAGEMIVFDNRRILHGRTAFDPNTGFRHLRGCYVDRGEWDSRIRIMSRPQQKQQVA